MSVVVPARDDEQGLAFALAGLAAQTEPPDEVLVVNAGSRPVSLPTDVPAVQVVEAGPALPGAARNRGARGARHDWVAFVDSGTRPVAGWLDALLRERQAQPQARVIYGTYAPALADEWDWAAAATYLAPARSPGEGRHPTSASVMVHRQVWEALGGMREDLRAGEDLLFFREVEARGIPGAVASEAKVVWQLPSGLAAHYRRLRAYSRSTWGTALSSTWQIPVLRMYLGAAAVSAAALLHPAVLLALPIGLALRVGRNYARRRHGLEGGLSPSRLGRMVAMTAAADAGTLLGIWDALWP